MTPGRRRVSSRSRATSGGPCEHLLLSIVPTRISGGRGCFLLGADITEQKAMQEALARSERALRRQATILDERNTALKVLLEQREQDQRELEQRIVSNVDQLIEPTLERLSRSFRHRPERLELDALRANLREIVGPFGQRLAESGAGRPRAHPPRKGGRGSRAPRSDERGDRRGARTSAAPPWPSTAPTSGASWASPSADRSSRPTWRRSAATGRSDHIRPTRPLPILEQPVLVHVVHDAPARPLSTFPAGRLRAARRLVCRSWGGVGDLRAWRPRPRRRPGPPLTGSRAARPRRRRARRAPARP